MRSNCYSRQWFQLFQEPIPDTRTTKEAASICDCLPLPHFRRVADVCCGAGRHAHALAELGYSVTGIERDAVAIAKARSLGGAASYVETDIRAYRAPPGAFDAFIVMSQSFGYFDSKTNRDVLRRLAAAIRPGGRIILDLWNPEFFLASQGARDLETPGGVVRETKRIKADRLYVNLKYPSDIKEQFEWELFTPSKMNQLANSVDLVMQTSCTDFNLATPPSPSNPRIQFVLERAESKGHFDAAEYERQPRGSEWL